MYLDVVALLMLMPFADCVVKSAMLANPYYRRFVQAAGYISNADSASLLDACVDSLKRGRTWCCSRKAPAPPPARRRSSAAVRPRWRCAAAARCMPVLIHCTPPALTKSRSWWQVPEQPWRLLVKLLSAPGPGSLRLRATECPTASPPAA